MADYFFMQEGMMQVEIQLSSKTFLVFYGFLRSTKDTKNHEEHEGSPRK